MFHLMWMPTNSTKGEDHCWMKANRCLSTPSEPPLRPSYWLFRVATISLHISCINLVGCAVWLENTRLHRCFHRIQRVSLVLFAYALILVDMSPVSLGCSTLHAMAMNAQSRKMRISGHITFLLCF